MENARLKAIVIGIVLSVGPLIPQVSGYTTYWRVASGNWSGAGNWSRGEPYFNSPDDAVDAIVENGDTAQITEIGESCGNFGLAGYVLMTSGDLWVSGCAVGYDGTGSFTQTGGKNTASLLSLGYGPTDGGIYDLSGNGNLDVDYGYIGNKGTGAFTQSGGGHLLRYNLCLGFFSGSSGTYVLGGGELLTLYQESIGEEGTGIFTQTGGTNTAYQISLGHGRRGYGNYDLSGNGSLAVNYEWIGYEGTATFTQSAGTHRVGLYDLEDGGILYLGLRSGSDGTYELRGGELLAYFEALGVGDDGPATGTFLQSGGTNTILGQLRIGDGYGATGTYDLSDTGIVDAGAEFIGYYGNGVFYQSGGTNGVDRQLLIGRSTTGDGSYQLSGDGYLVAYQEVVGVEGKGRFIQSGGTNDIYDYILLAPVVGSSGTYELRGGTLNVGGAIDVAWQGTASFVVDGGIINGTSEQATLWVHGNRGSLTGPGTFNIRVVYLSDEIYGTGDDSVAVRFNPNCLKRAGAFSVTQIKPPDFARGRVPNLLPSSVFDVSFPDSHCGEFTIEIPYNQAEVVDLDVNETSLVILHETEPGKYEWLKNVVVDEANDIISGVAHTFGKFAVAKGKEFMITFDDGPVLGNTESIVNALKNVKLANGKPVRAGFFMVGVGCCEGSIRYCPGWDRWQEKGSVRMLPDVARTVHETETRHVIGVHTQHHPNFEESRFSSLEFIKQEISECNEAIEKAIKHPNPNRVFRPPYFSATPNVYTACSEKELGFQIILGAGREEVAAVDAFGPAWSRARSQIQSWDRDYPCVLTFHDIIPSTAENIAKIIEYLQDGKGFVLVHFDPWRLPRRPDSLVHSDTSAIHQSEIVPHAVPLDSTVNTATFTVSWEGSELDLVLYKPDGTRIDSNSALVDPNIKYAERETFEYYTISDPNPGNWVMEVVGADVPPEGEKYTIRVEGDTNLMLSGFTDKPEYGLNEQIKIKAELAKDQNSVTGAIVAAKVQRPDGSVDNLTLYDDGTHGDEEPNDGFYANAYNNTSLRGSYEIGISAIGGLGEDNERASLLKVMVGSIIYGDVDFNRYAIFAEHWLDQNCTEPAWCETADIDQNGEVDLLDHSVLAEFWLEDIAP